MRGVSKSSKDPYLFLRAVGGKENARNILATFVTRIRLFPDRAVVHYPEPLPSHSDLAGATEQEILFSPSTAP